MSTTLEVSTKNPDDKLTIKMAMSHVETLVGIVNGCLFSEPYSKFGWTFFKIALKPELQIGIEKKFSDMIEKYTGKTMSEKFIKFITDYFNSKGCQVRVKFAD